MKGSLAHAAVIESPRNTTLELSGFNEVFCSDTDQEKPSLRSVLALAVQAHKAAKQFAQG